MAGQAVVNYYQDNAAQIVYNLTGGAHWTHTATTLVDAGSAVSITQTSADTATYTLQAGDAAVYGVFYLNVPLSPANIPTVTVTLAGVQVGDPIPLFVSAPTLFQQVHRVLVPLIRRKQMVALGGAAGQAVVITVNNVSASVPVSLNGLLVPNGALGLPLGGVLACLGDSWTVGGGVSQSGQMAWPEQLAVELGATLGRRIQQVNFGLNGDFMLGETTTQAGGTWRTYADINGVFANGVIAAQPEFLTILFGPNDLGGGPSAYSARQVAQNYFRLLCFIEDTLDTSTAGLLGKVAVGTPGYTGIEMQMPRTVLGGNRLWSQALENYEQAVYLVRQVCNQFSWCRVASIFEVMDYRDNLVYPNQVGDVGNHPNDLGHGLVAREFLRAFLGL